MFSQAEMVVEIIMTKSVLLMNHSFEGSNASGLEQGAFNVEWFVRI